MTATVTDLAARRRTTGTLEALYATGACKADRCHVAINWVVTVRLHPRTGARLLSGKPIPIDHGRDPYGPIVLDKQRDGTWAARPVDGDDPGDIDPRRPHYTVHWSGCINPALYLGVKRAADPHGILPTLTPRAAPLPPSAYRKCPACRERPPDYTSGGELCLPCARAAVARWSRGMVPTIRRWTDEKRELMLVTEDSPVFRAIVASKCGR